MSAANDLASLGALDRTLLHVFVAGPGVGEGIAVALPERGWFFVDGCQAGRGLPLLAIYRAWKDDPDPVDCMALTHPHTDHASGFRGVLEEVAPTHVAITAMPHDPLGAIDVLVPPGSAVTSAGQRRSVVADALGAFKRHAVAHPTSPLALHTGATIPTSTAAVEIVARGPDVSTIAAQFSAWRMGGPSVVDPNELSAVFELTFGGTRVVLGSDLVTSGWQAVLAARPELGEHHALKVPHHGSSTAHHPGLMRQGQERAWLVAPFSRCHLPAVHSHGLPWLVARNGAVLLTAAPLARDRLPLPPARVPLVDVAAYFAGTSPPSSGAFAVSPPRGLQALDAVWCVAFDDRGSMVGRWRGPRAFSVVA